MTAESEVSWKTRRHWQCRDRNYNLMLILLRFI